ncbi:hypothetical protein ACLOJK_033968 [Asimina triloba]
MQCCRDHGGCNYKMDTFRVRLRLPQELSSPHVDKWMKMAIAAAGARQLSPELDDAFNSNRWNNDRPWYHFPYHVFDDDDDDKAHSRLQHLYLRFVILLHHPPHLKGLDSLRDVGLEKEVVSDKDLLNLLSNSPLVKSVRLIKRVVGFVNLEIIHRRLEYLHVEIGAFFKSLQGITVSAVNLVRFDYRGPPLIHFSSIQVPHLLHCSIRFNFLASSFPKNGDSVSFALTNLSRHLPRLQALLLEPGPHKGQSEVEMSGFLDYECLMELHCAIRVKSMTIQREVKYYAAGNGQWTQHHISPHKRILRLKDSFDTRKQITRTLESTYSD